MRRHRRQVRRRRDGDAGLPSVRDYQPAALCGQVAHALRLGQPADASHVGLGDVDAASVHQVDELESCREPLARRHLHRRAQRELGVPVEVVGPKRRLDEEHVVFGPRLDDRQRALDGVPGVRDVDHDREVRPHGLAHAADDLDDPGVGLV